MLKHIKKYFEALFRATPMSIKEIQKKSNMYRHLMGMTPEAKNLYFMIRQEESIRREKWILIFAVTACLLAVIPFFK